MAPFTFSMGSWSGIGASTLIGGWPLNVQFMSGQTKCPIYSRDTYSWLGPHGQSIEYRNFDQAGIEFQSRWDYISNNPGLIFDQGGIEFRLGWNQWHSMTHVLVLSAKVRRNEWLWHTLDIVVCSGELLAWKIQKDFNLRNKITEKFAVLMISIFLHMKNLHHLYFSKSGAKSLKWTVTGASTLSTLISTKYHHIAYVPI